MASEAPLLAVDGLQAWYGESHILHGMSFEVAWRRCHDESVAMASLNRRLQEDMLFNPML